MRVAVCISGELRTFNPDHYREVFGDVDFFLHTNEYDERIKKLNPVIYSYENIDFRRHPYFKINQDINPYDFLHSPQRVHPIFYEEDLNQLVDLEVERPGKWSSKPKHVLSMFYSIMQSNFLKKTYERDKKFEYDLVVRTRPDIDFIDEIKYSNYDDQSVWTPQTPNNLNGLYVNDHFAVSDSKNMDLYSEVFLNIPRLFYINKVDLIPEILLKRYLDEVGLTISEYGMDYVVRRNDGRNDVYMIK